MDVYQSNQIMSQNIDVKISIISSSLVTWKLSSTVGFYNVLYTVSKEYSIGNN